MAATYEIVRRESHQHRAGHHTLLINGIDAEITVDPAQFQPKALREALASGATGPDLALKAAEICDEYAARALQRRVERIQAGSIIPGGVPFGANGALDTRRIPKTPRRNEAAAVEAFLHRGRLKGLSKEERQERSKRLAAKHDSQAEWLESRKALIAAREGELAAVKEAGGPKAARLIAMLENEIAALKAPILCASHGFQYAYTQYLTGAINLASDDIRIWPLMTNTTLDTVRDAVDTFSDVTADEFDGANYTSGGLALDSQAVAVDDANDRAEFDAADETVSALGAGTRDIQGIALGKFVTNTAASIPLHWIEFAANKRPDGSDFTFAFNAEGILQAADG